MPYELVRCPFGDADRIFEHRDQAPEVPRSSGRHFWFEHARLPDSSQAATSSSFIEVLAPMPTDDAFALAVRRITETQGLLCNNDVDAARLALEAVRDELDTTAAGAPKPKERSLAERRAAVV